MKYLAALVVFLSIITLTLLTTPASQAGGSIYVNGGYPGGNGFVTAPGYGRYPGYGCGFGNCNRGFNGPGFYNTPFYGPLNTVPVTVYPVLINTTGAFDNIYGPGASAARRLAPYSNTNIYHGW